MSIDDYFERKKNLLNLTLHKHEYLFLPAQLLPNMLNTHPLSTWSAQVFQKKDKKSLSRYFLYTYLNYECSILFIQYKFKKKKHQQKNKQTTHNIILKMCSSFKHTDLQYLPIF